MTSHRQRNDRRDDRRGPVAPPPRGAASSRRRRIAEASSEWLWGWHAVSAALRNPARPSPKAILATAERARQLSDLLGPKVRPEVSDNAAISRRLPPGAVHQGVALHTPALEPVTLEELADPAEGFLLMLDQVTDPQNVGTIFRSAAAFGARGVILQDRHAPPLAGALAKAAAGAIDQIPHARAVNLSRALERLDALGWRAVGLDGEAPGALDAVLDGRPCVLVMGSEGEGLRRLVREHCDALASIPMPGGFESLNVSAAAAVALYEMSRRTARR